MMMMMIIIIIIMSLKRDVLHILLSFIIFYTRNDRLGLQSRCFQTRPYCLSTKAVF